MATMDSITNVTIKPLKEQSNFVKPFRMTYMQTGNTKSWDLVLQKPSVCAVIYNKSRKKLVLVKQFRPAVYASVIGKQSKLENFNTTNVINAEHGITLELCAGMMDKLGKSPKEIAQLEVLEECGYDVALDKFEHILTFLSGVGIGGENMHLFYVEVTDQMRISKGGGLESEGEMIDVVEMSCQEVELYLNRSKVKSPMFTIFGLTWFLKDRATYARNNFNLSNMICMSAIGLLAFVTGMIWSSS